MSAPFLPLIIFYESLYFTTQISACHCFIAPDETDNLLVWNETFVDPETGKTRNKDDCINDTQCAYGHLVRTTKEAGCTVWTGFWGTGALNPMLTQAGRVTEPQREIRIP